MQLYVQDNAGNENHDPDGSVGSDGQQMNLVGPRTVELIQIYA